MSPKQKEESVDVMVESAPPSASSLTEALRGIGYSLPTAVADIIDNSISAGASRVNIEASWKGEDSHLSILDDGCGMSADELHEAMRLGTHHPDDERENSDLGRFGLGLKTASFSQARRLVVASKKKGKKPAVRFWDLDYIKEWNDWQLCVGLPEDSDIELEPLNRQEQGTLVWWEKLDRVVGRYKNEARAEAAFYDQIHYVELHLAMVFHRYLEAGDLQLLFREQPVKPWNPFLPWEEATTPTPTESIRGTRAHRVQVKGYILPHKDRLTRELHQEAAGPDGWIAQQGFYVYRNRRMLMDGSWLHLGWTKEAPYQLARLSVEFPNNADDEWKIDVKKSVARPPRYLRSRLKDLAHQVREDARKVFVHRGNSNQRKPRSGPVEQIWQSLETKDGIRYRIDRSHPLVSEILGMAGSQSAVVDAMLQLIEQTVPIQTIWLDTSDKDELAQEPFEGDEAKIMDVLRTLYLHFVEQAGFSHEGAIEVLQRTEPFDTCPALIACLEERDTQ